MSLSPKIYYKQPWEEETIKIDFSSRIESGDSISSAIIKMYSDGIDVTTSMIISTSIISPYIYVKIKDGTDGMYNLALQITLTSGEKREEDLMVSVKEQM
ncbi:hypothetical protein AUJ63_04210 [Candidatus Pacearchaeota archaeon CG1_02_35_32]|nr:MAG: hypothetical protein AUJ63_04210 [Candidatus Pacearchaeota archaeon CG1_02_35_32]